MFTKDDQEAAWRGVLNERLVNPKAQLASSSDLARAALACVAEKRTLHTPAQVAELPDETLIQEPDREMYLVRNKPGAVWLAYVSTDVDGGVTARVDELEFPVTVLRYGS